jgi:hypothetical protein
MISHQKPTNHKDAKPTHAKTGFATPIAFLLQNTESNVNLKAGSCVGLCCCRGYPVILCSGSLRGACEEAALVSDFGSAKKIRG